MFLRQINTQWVSGSLLCNKSHELMFPTESRQKCKQLVKENNFEITKP